MKEWSRQISELSQDDFSLLHTAATLSSSSSGLPLNTCDVSIATSVESAVFQQLCSLLEKLRSVDAMTSDSGAISDYSENTDGKSHSLTSLDLEDSQQTGSCNIKGACEAVYNLSSEATETVIKDGATVFSLEKRDKNSAINDVGEDIHMATSSSSERDEYSTARETQETPEDMNHLKEEQTTGNDSCAYNEKEEKKTEQLPVELPAGNSKESDGEQLAEHPSKTANERTEDKREPVSWEQSRIKRKTKRHYSHGYNSWTRSYGYNSRFRNSYHDNSRSNRCWQQTSLSRDPRVQKHSTFNHEEVAAFLWNSELFYVVNGDKVYLNF